LPKFGGFDASTYDIDKYGCLPTVTPSLKPLLADQPSGALNYGGAARIY
jgi:hypothetical protein